MTDIGRHFGIVSDLYHLRFPDPREYGYEDDGDFRHAMWRLADYWRGRTGECVDERYGLLLLRFHDTPGGRPDEAWLPRFLLYETDPSVCVPPSCTTDGDVELDEAYGFD